MMRVVAARGSNALLRRDEPADAETEGMIGYLLEQGHRNGFEYNLVLAAAVFALAGVGAGAWSLGEALDINLAGTGWALAALGAWALGGLGAIVSGRLALAGCPIPTQQEGRSGHGEIAGQPLN